MDIVQAIFTALASIMTGLIDLIVQAFTGVTSLWYTPGSGSTSGQLTLLGVLTLIAFAFGVVWLAIRFIGSMIALKQVR